MVCVRERFGPARRVMQHSFDLNFHGGRPAKPELFIIYYLFF
jgi:hypothetical protein